MTSLFVRYSHRVLYIASVFVSAFLLFQIQPIMAKLILPWLGGSPAVWQTAMLFFQLLLLAGYLYVHLAFKFLDIHKQIILHGVLILLALAFLPLRLHTNLGFEGTENPVFWLLISLFYSVSLPFFVLSASAPLLQRWFAELPDPSARNPYFLYSASNVGSLLALLSYPFAIEPLLGVQEQILSWTGLFALFALLLVLCMRAIFVRSAHPSSSPLSEAPELFPTMKGRLFWLVFAFTPSSLMLGVTTYTTMDIAAVPLLWIIPLALYLLTFVLCFAPGMPLYRLSCFLFPVCLLLIIVTLRLFPDISPFIRLAIHFTTFFVMAMVCHGQLALARPGVSHLTEYYVWMSLGGALGGIFNALLAPHWFSDVMEYWYLALFTALLVPGARTTRRLQTTLMDILLPLLLFGFATGILLRPEMLPLPASWNAYFDSPTGLPVMKTIYEAGIYVLMVIVTIIFARKRRIRFVLCCTVLLFLGPLFSGEGSKKLLVSERNFFGVSRVIEDSTDHYRLYQHGTTVHGIQSLGPKKALQPMGYYHHVGEVITALPEHLRNGPMALTGLGVGTLTCYGTKGQQIDLYEIDQAVVDIASDPKLFTYLRDCPGEKHILLGDARIKLQEADDRKYGIMMMDAYSSDSLPVHLLTREALALYRQKLREDGVLFFHITNRTLRLEPVLANLAADAGMRAYSKTYGTGKQSPLMFRNQWVLLTKSESNLGSFHPSSMGWKPLAPNDTRLWTDDFSNIVAIIK